MESIPCSSLMYSVLIEPTGEVFSYFKASNSARIHHESLFVSIVQSSAMDSRWKAV